MLVSDFVLRRARRSDLKRIATVIFEFLVEL